MQAAGSERPMSPLVAVLWSFALLLVEMMCVEATEAARPGAAVDFVNLGACAVLATSVLVFAVVRVHARDASLRVTLGVRPPAPLHVALAVAAGAGMFPLLATVDALIQRRFPQKIDEITTEVLSGITTHGARVAFVVAMYAVVPIARELFFRGVLFSELRRATGARVAVVSTAMLFAGFEIDLRRVPTYFCLGLALGVVRERTGTVLAAIVAHLAFEAVEAIPLLRGRSLTADFAYPTKWIVGGAVISLLALLAVGAGKKTEE